MKSLIRWTITNTPAMNTLMIAILAVGLASLMAMRREVFPEFDLDYITITVPYPGASPEEVEEGICQKIEEAVRSRDGIKKIMSSAREGVGIVVLELYSSVPDVQKVLNEIRSDVDRIPSLPELAEDPEIEQILIRRPAIRVGVIGPENESPESEILLRDIAEQIRDELLQLPSVSQVELVGVRDYQIDIELSEETLRKYGLTLQQVARIVRRENIEMPGGNMKTDSQEILLRGKNKRLLGSEIARIPLVTQSDGVVLTVGDLGVVRDEFVDTTAIHRINGKPGMVIAVQKTSSEDLLQIVDEVKQFLDETKSAGGYALPAGYSLVTYDDNSVMVHDRINLLAKNGVQGFLLVLVVLAVFLELRLAAWVAIGIPISILGGTAIMLGMGQTLNMLSLFAFLMVLGMLVDDAIVVGENVFTHRQSGKKLIEAAVDGTCEVLPSVIASISTTIIAFAPLLFMPGIMGKFIAVMPLGVIAMLLISLVEATFILPCHLAHESHPERFHRLRRRAGSLSFLLPWSAATLAIWGLLTLVLVRESVDTTVAIPLSAAVFVLAILPHLLYWTGPLGRMLRWIHEQVFDRINRGANRILGAFVRGVYLPVLRWSLRNAPIALAAATAVLLLSIGLCMTDRIKFVYMPKMDGNTIMASITYPDGTPASVTEAATRRMEEAVYAVAKKYDTPDQPLIELVHRTVGQPSTLGRVGPTGTAEGSHLGTVGVEIVPAEQRDIRSIEIVNEWRKAAGDFPGAENVEFGTAGGGPGGSPIEFRLLARPRDMDQLELAIEECKEELKRHPGVFDIKDDSQPGKWEFQVTVKDDAKSLGLSAADLAETVRAAYYGEEVMRLQRGRHEVKLMVRYPREQRRSLADFENIRVRMQPSMSSILGRAAAAGTRSSSSPATSTQTAGVSMLAGAAERPLTELADIQVERGYSAINRLDQRRSITITADVNEDIGNAQEIVNAMKADFFPSLMGRYPGLRLNWEGQQEQTRESIAGLKIGMALALVAMFALLTLEFRSYAQPVMILLIIPFGAIGAIIGHLVMGLDITMFSLFGLVALSGVVINDSIVLIDFMNHRVRAGIALHEALLDAGRRRFRPVLLTSVTTIAGLLPILFERSFQAQVLIPMATSMAFGLMFTTVLMLILVPTMYLVYVRIAVGDESRMVVEPERETENATMQFCGMEQLPASSKPSAVLEGTHVPGDDDLVRLEPVPDASSRSSDNPTASDDNDDGDDTSDDGNEDNDKTSRVAALPREQTWPPPSHLRRTGGQD